MKTKSTLKKAILAMVGVLALNPTLSQANAFEPVLNDKLIKVRPRLASTANTLQVEIKTEKTSYKVNEKIRFQIKSNQDVYVYMFNLDPKTEESIVILPNKYQTKHRIKYPGNNQWQLLPNKKLEFYADRAGIERIVIVASPKYIDLDKKLNGTNSKSTGNFHLMDNTLETLNTGINEAYSTNDKLMKVRLAQPNSPALPDNFFIKELNLRVR